MESDDYEKQLNSSRQYWDKEAPVFDEEADHGLRDPATRDEWKQLLIRLLPQQQSSILDIGCGTGSLSLLMAELNHQVVGIDLSTEMISLAKKKRGNLPITFQEMDAYAPTLNDNNYDVIVCRHLLWAMPDTEIALQRWSQLLKPEGKLILIEGFWSTGVGLHPEDIHRALPTTFTQAETISLSENELFWGGEVTDERYVVTATYSP